MQIHNISVHIKHYWRICWFRTVNPVWIIKILNLNGSVKQRSDILGKKIIFKVEGVADMEK